MCGRRRRGSGSLRLRMPGRIRIEKEGHVGVFQDLRSVREAKALRHLLFAERDSEKHVALAGRKQIEDYYSGRVGAGKLDANIAVE